MDCGCDMYSMVDSQLARRLRLPYVDRTKRRLRGFADKSAQTTTKGVVAFDLEISGHVEKVYAHVVDGLDVDVFLGKPWMERNHVVYDAAKRRIWHGKGGVRAYLSGQEESAMVREIREARSLGAPSFAALCRRVATEEKRQPSEYAAGIRAISLADIDKALKPKGETDHFSRLPQWVREEYGDLFEPSKAYPLPPPRPGIDLTIDLERQPNGREAPLPWGPLYSMSREELLVLRNTLKDLLDKGFIRASSSSAGAPVLFVRKPGGGLRFCCDYRALNAITRKDRYPLPLINETLQRVSSAKWFTKLDVVAAFHKIRVAEGHQEKTAFRTRYGLFEWIVCPFGLTGAPAMFQRYMNQTLSEFLDDFASAYMDDVLVYSNGSKADHEKKVRRILRALSAAGLNLDPAKSEFSVQTVKYVGFILRAGQGIACDAEKVRTIREWLAPKTVKGVRSFLGFANYYRVFIRDYSAIVEPLNALTKKGAPFEWTTEQDAAFETLKERFASAPLLRSFDPDLATVVETDCSGFALGGSLSQEDPSGVRRPVAFHSQKLTPTQYNYPIHDKELLAVMSCLSAWDAELRSSRGFRVITDHKGLEYFMKKQKLTERQSRWAEQLSRYHFKIEYRPGRLSAAPDALSRREQDAPTGWDDEREKGRIIQAIPDSARPTAHAVRRTEAADVPEPPEADVFVDDAELQRRWNEVKAKDRQYLKVYEAVSSGTRALPPELGLKLQIAECGIDALSRLTWRERLWVPGHEDPDHDDNALRTEIIQRCHGSPATNHPGRNATAAVLARQFYWPGQSSAVRRFVRNCDACGGSTIWRQAKRGLLQPLAVPERIKSDLAMDFITDLPPSSKSGARFLWVIVDRLAKSVTLEPMVSMEAEACADRFLNCHFRFHGMPRTIVSDRGSNWTSKFWRRFCAKAGIEQRLSTAFHPQTDGATERFNQEIEAILRRTVAYAQNDWEDQLPATQLSLNNRVASATELSPFFIEHGYNVEPLRVHDSVPEAANEREAKADSTVRKLVEATKFAQAAMAASQERMERTANGRRAPAERFEVGDKVWLHMGNYRSPRPSKKLDWLHHKYEVIEVTKPTVMRLDVPGNIHPYFHVSILRRAANDPLPGQQRTDERPPPIKEDDGDYWLVKEVLAARWKRVGRGQRREVLVKWEGYQELTWEPLSSLRLTDALEEFEQRYGPADKSDGDPNYQSRTRKRRKPATVTRITAAEGKRTSARGQESNQVKARRPENYSAPRGTTQQN